MDFPRRILPNLVYTREAGSYIDAMHTVLQGRGAYPHVKAMLAGMTAACFRFSVHRRLHPDSPTAYNWMAEHLVAADLIGLTASQAAGYHQKPTFPLYQEEAVQQIIAAIDGGTGVIFWKDQFAVLVGYDRHQNCFYYLDGDGTEVRTLAINEFGRNRTPYWYYQILEEQAEVEWVKVIKESYVQAIAKWETHELMLPEAEYACGRSAYKAIAAALKTSNYDPAGTVETMSVYAAAKRMAAAYAAEAVGYWPSLAPVVQRYAELGELWTGIESALAAEETPIEPFDEALTKLMVKQVEAAGQIEDEALAQVGTLLREPIANRFGDIGLR